jgi:DMSO/TMAO reductase YedYZ molybdopterin-dependent catalytic subunit
MKKRREFLKMGIGVTATGMGLLFPFWLPVRYMSALAGKREIVPKGTKLETLKDKNPADLDTRHLSITPLEDFGTMGLSDYKQNMAEWRLRVGGRDKNPLQLSYEEIQILPAIERDVLLICPGFFANHGRWKGISMPALLKRARVENDITHVRFSGPEGPYEKVEQFPINEVLSHKVFLSYRVNGQRLPVKNGFPLRLVAEAYYGYTWIKYVSEVKVIKAA